MFSSSSPTQGNHSHKPISNPPENPIIPADYQKLNILTCSYINCNTCPPHPTYNHHINPIIQLPINLVDEPNTPKPPDRTTYSYYSNKTDSHSRTDALRLTQETSLGLDDIQDTLELEEKQGELI